MSSPLIGILVPAYNAERFLAQAIESVLAQSYPHWELILVDDGSWDGTARIALEYAARDPRLHYHHQPHQGLAQARNHALRRTDAEWIAFLDADDLWLPDKLSRQVEALNRTGADLLYTGGYVFWEDDLANRRRCSEVPGGSRGGESMYRLLARQNRFAVSSVSIRRSLLEAVGAFDESPGIYGAEDYDLWLRVARVGGRFYGLPDPLICYRVHRQAMSRDVDRMLQSLRNVLARHLLLEETPRNRYRHFRRMATIAYLDEYFLRINRCEFRGAIHFIRHAWRMSPATLLHPHRLGAIVKNGLGGVFSYLI